MTRADDRWTRYRLADSPATTSAWSAIAVTIKPITADNLFHDAGTALYQAKTTPDTAYRIRSPKPSHHPGTR